MVITLYQSGYVGSIPDPGQIQYGQQQEVGYMLRRRKHRHQMKNHRRKCVILVPLNK